MALAAILIWYLVIGALAAIGSVTISRSRFSPRVEHMFFALLLIPIGAMYLAFVAYFGDYSTLRARGLCGGGIRRAGAPGPPVSPRSSCWATRSTAGGTWCTSSGCTLAPGPAARDRSPTYRWHTGCSARRTTGAWRPTSIPDGRPGSSERRAASRDLSAAPPNQRMELTGASLLRNVG